MTLKYPLKSHIPWNKGLKGQIPWNKGLKGYGKWSKTKGMKFSEETKKKMSESQKRIGNKPPKPVGKKSEETIKRMSIAQKLRPSRYGKDSPHWKGGITTENHKIRTSIEFRLWREAVFTRDNWTCRECDKKGGTIHAHHIENFKDYPELRLAIDNGLTLCKKCHLKEHTKGILTAQT